MTYSAIGMPVTCEVVNRVPPSSSIWNTAMIGAGARALEPLRSGVQRQPEELAHGAAVEEVGGEPSNIGIGFVPRDGPVIDDEVAVALHPDERDLRDCGA